MAAYWALPLRIPLAGADSIASTLTPFFASLPGFYIAALAAVATFNGADLDREMEGVSAPMILRGEKKDSEITLRVFLCYLFSYLTAFSFIGFFICSSASLLAENIGEISRISANILHVDRYITDNVLRNAFIVSVTFVGAMVASCTSLGLYFLSERVHQDLS
ncbi:MAG: hypothetical protein Q8L23_12960 [Caulobacter sp.]|nr:hypothetical protein [Caulobacter sp.]